jgi:hypothetical protein
MVIIIISNLGRGIAGAEVGELGSHLNKVEFH